MYEMGARDGMEIVALNGTSVEELANEANSWFCAFPIEEDEAFFNGLAVMSKLQGTLPLTYKDERGEEHAISLEEQARYVYRFDETYEILVHDNRNGNLTYHMLDEDTAYFSLNNMMIDESIGRESFGGEVEQDRSYEAGKKEYDVYEEIVCPAENEWGDGEGIIG